MDLTHILIAAELVLVGVFLVSYLVVSFTREKNDKKDFCILLLLMVCSILLLSDFLAWTLDGKQGDVVRVVLYISNYLVYTCNYLMIAIFGHYFWHIIRKDNEEPDLILKAYWIIVSAFIIYHTIGVFFGINFYLDANNVYHRGDLFWLANLPGFIGAAILFYLFIKYFKRLSLYNRITSACYFILPTFAAGLSLFVLGAPIEVLTISLTTLITFFVREQDMRIALKKSLKDESENKLALEKRMDIIQSVIKIYYASYYVDLEANVYEELSTNKSGRERYSSKGEPQSALYDMCKFLILPEFKEDMEAFVNLSTINERMKDKNVITLKFIGITAGWSEAIFIAGDRREDGTLRSVIWASRMIHEEKKREDEYMQNLLAAKVAAESANAAKTAFLFNMSHDIRTPMNAIIGYTDLIEKHYDNKEKCMDYLHKAKQANQFLLSLINNVLEMARIESGKSEIDEEPCNIRQFLAGISRIFEEQMQAKDLTFTRRVNITNNFVLCDISKISEIYLNLLSNSLKYTLPGGTVTAELDQFPCEEEGKIILRAVVSDTGIGMSEDFLPHIFEEFTREKSSTESRQQGTGLGMPIVKKLVEQLGGSISVESKLGVGTKFTLFITFKVCEQQADDSNNEVDLSTIDFKGKRILLAEDNDLNAEIAMEILGEAGFEIERASDGLVCVEMLNKSDDLCYDIILMDIQMPNMDGYKATQVIRKLENKNKASIPILAMTANAFEEDKKNAIEAGMNGHLAKPIDVNALMNTLSNLLK